MKLTINPDNKYNLPTSAARRTKLCDSTCLLEIIHKILKDQLIVQFIRSERRTKTLLDHKYPHSESAAAQESDIRYDQISQQQKDTIM